MKKRKNGTGTKPGTAIMLGDGSLFWQADLDYAENPVAWMINNLFASASDSESEGLPGFQWNWDNFSHASDAVATQVPDTQFGDGTVVTATSAASVVEGFVASVAPAASAGDPLAANLFALHDAAMDAMEEQADAESVADEEMNAGNDEAPPAPAANEKGGKGAAKGGRTGNSRNSRLLREDLPQTDPNAGSD